MKDTESASPPLYAQGAASPPQGGQPLWLKTSDGLRLRAAYWPATAAPARGAVMMFQGRTEFIEKYYEPVQRFLDLGFAVLTFDWRGQGLSERPLAGQRRRRRGYIHNFKDFQRDVDAALSALAERAPSGPWLLVAHSMGGAVAARLLMRQAKGGADKPAGPGFKAAVLSAPMLGLYGSGGGFGARIASGLAVSLGLGRGYAVGSDASFMEELVKERQLVENPLTSDLGRFEQRYAVFLREHPDLALGGATWRWLWAARREQAQLKPTDIPLLALLGDAEVIVSSEAIRRYVAGNPNASLAFIEGGARHEVFLESDAHQARVWSEIEAFLEREIPRG